MNKKKKIELLNKIKGSIGELKKKKNWSPEFKSWLTQSELILKKVFDKEPEYVEKFKDINYSLLVFSTSTPEWQEQQVYEDGLDEAYSLIESYIENIEMFEEDSDDNISKEEEININSNEVFIVHGRDNESKLEVARYLEKLTLKPIILHEQASGGKTIIEKIEEYTNVRYAVVLYTPCDVGGLKGSRSEELRERARQNVVFEHGYLMGKIGRKNVAALVKGNIETPNDISGVVYISMQEKGWKLDLAKELKEAGYELDWSALVS
ncbi:nucleotide-binding protein [Clostridium perfringens]|uniref:TIR domain-containing protein n=1 Tax=Clostridium perfringens TaxID=1502 RepID=UPI0013E305A5|nr:nucleotide-binding protein [Clostridium perfringens]MDM0749084.1 nucleotide-binding protein [Clostridium perfringens]NGT92551.1 nucleotide-binding protein [Clostridium perfringens]